MIGTIKCRAIGLISFLAIWAVCFSSTNLSASTRLTPTEQAKRACWYSIQINQTGGSACYEAFLMNEQFLKQIKSRVAENRTGTETALRFAATPSAGEYRAPGMTFAVAAENLEGDEPLIESTQRRIGELKSLLAQGKREITDRKTYCQQFPEICKRAVRELFHAEHFLAQEIEPLFQGRSTVASIAQSLVAKNRDILAARQVNMESLDELEAATYAGRAAMGAPGDFRTVEQPRQVNARPSGTCNGFKCMEPNFGKLPTTAYVDLGDDEATRLTAEAARVAVAERAEMNLPPPPSPAPIKASVDGWNIYNGYGVGHTGMRLGQNSTSSVGGMINFTDLDGGDVDAILAMDDKFNPVVGANFEDLNRGISATAGAGLMNDKPFFLLMAKFWSPIPNATPMSGIR